MEGAVIAALVALVVGVAIGYILHRIAGSKRVSESKDFAKRIVDEARKEAQAHKKEAMLQAHDDIFNQKKELEQEFKERERELKNKENKIQDKEERLEKKLENANQKESDALALEKSLTQKERDVREKEERLEAVTREQEQRLQEISGLSADEARRQLLEDIEARTRHEAAKMIRLIETEARENADRKAKEILAMSIQRYAGDFVSEQTVTSVTLPSEDMKGRIIGREGRNIRALEAATGVDLIIDDTPETVILSAYNPLRRMVAKMAPGAAYQRRTHPPRAHRRRSEKGGAGTGSETAGNRRTSHLRRGRPRHPCRNRPSAGANSTTAPATPRTSWGTPWKWPFSAASWPRN